MKKIFLQLTFATLFLLSPLFVNASNEADSLSKPKGTWSTTSKPALKVDHKYYNNWSSTGNSQISLISSSLGNYKYTHPKYIWDNVVDLAFGLYWQDLDGNQTLESLRKNDDKIDITSTYSMRLKNSWNVNASANFKSQFYDGFQYGEDTVLVSTCMAPGYLTTSLGFEYKKDFWNVSLSFLTGKTTFLVSDRVIDAGQLYGVDTTGGKRAYFALGSYIKLFFKKDIAPRLNLYTRFELFYDYNKPSQKVSVNDWNSDKLQRYNTYLKRSGYCLFHDTDVDFELTLEYRFSSWLAAYFSCNLKYDTDFATQDPDNANLMLPSKGLLGPWQFYESAGLQIYFNWHTPKS